MKSTLPTLTINHPLPFVVLFHYFYLAPPPAGAMPFLSSGLYRPGPHLLQLLFANIAN